MSHPLGSSVSSYLYLEGQKPTIPNQGCYKCIMHGKGMEGNGHGQFAVYQSTCLEGLRKITKDHRQSNKSSGRDLNQQYPEYEVPINIPSSSTYLGHTKVPDEFNSTTIEQGTETVSKHT